MRDPEGDVPSAGVTDEMDGTRVERGDEGRDVFRVLLDGEIVAIAVPALRPAVPQADRDRPVARAEGLHLQRPGPIIAQRPMHEDQRRAGPALDETPCRYPLTCKERHERLYSAALRFAPFRASTGFRYAPV